VQTVLVDLKPPSELAMKAPNLLWPIFSFSYQP